MDEVFVLGVGMHRFGKFPEKSIKELGAEAVWASIKDAGVDPHTIEAAYVGNAYAGLTTGQEAIRGQVILRYAGISKIPIVNVENACASGSTAFREAYIAIKAGIYDVVLVLGVEKLFTGNTAKSLRALATATDVELMGRSGVQFTALYAMDIRNYMENYEATPEHLAMVVVKNSYNGSLNPYAQFRKPFTREEVLSSKMIAEPLTLYMCSSMADGAAAAILCSNKIARNHLMKTVRVAGSSLGSGQFQNYLLPPEETSIGRVARLCYEQAGISPSDIEFAEVHDAAAPSEFIQCESLGFCKPGEGFLMVEKGVSNITGRMPINPSGGLTSRGHPVGATGIAQIAEIVWQLRGQAGERQIKKDKSSPKTGLALNTGGRIDNDRAVIAIHILTR